MAALIAKNIYENKIVALLHGRSEIGPRALCHRSILANPTNPDMKDHLNAKVKHREGFRPFAPVVTAENQFTYFSLLQESPYMLLAAAVREEYADKLPAITHVDGSARVQSVKQTENPFVHRILTEFERLSGVSVLLNTSFNDCGEPIVESPVDALQTFLTTEIDVLVMENWILFKDEINN
jgi:carbamoyltransferase